MLKLASELILQKLLRFEKGEVDLYGVPVALLPISSYVEEQKILEKLGVENAIYFANKKTGMIWNENMLQKFKTKTHEQIVNEGNKVMSLAGWGEFKVVERNLKNLEFKWRIYNSTFAKEYGAAEKPVCNIIRGLFTGAACFLTNCKFDVLDGVETKCTSYGNDYCEFVIKKKTDFKTENPLVSAQLKQLK